MHSVSERPGRDRRPRQFGPTSTGAGRPDSLASRRALRAAWSASWPSSVSPMPPGIRTMPAAFPVAMASSRIPGTCPADTATTTRSALQGRAVRDGQQATPSTSSTSPRITRMSSRGKPSRIRFRRMMRPGFTSFADTP